jgi:putative oxidoreductase
MEMPGKLRRVLFRLLEAALGAAFLYVGLLKHWHPEEFAAAILAYQILPAGLVGLAAAVIPWLELTPGSLLILGFKRRSCLLLLALLAAGFMLLLLVTMARGLKIDCGCGLFFQRQVGLAAALEDGLFLAWAAALYWWELLQAPGELVQAGA